MAAWSRCALIIRNVSKDSTNVARISGRNVWVICAEEILSGPSDSLRTTPIGVRVQVQGIAEDAKADRTLTEEVRMVREGPGPVVIAEMESALKVEDPVGLDPDPEVAVLL